MAKDFGCQPAYTVKGFGILAIQLFDTLMVLAVIIGMARQFSSSSRKALAAKPRASTTSWLSCSPHSGPTDPQIARYLAHFIEQVRSIPADPIIERQNWLRAYASSTDRSAAALNDYVRTNDPFTEVGEQQIAVEVSSVSRASSDSFRVGWTERRCESEKLCDPVLDCDPDQRDPAATRCRKAQRQ
ncbi:VirB8 protein [Aminobacter aminovorans]|uniref:Conjugal transfer protein TrbF n=1 Tax=Aminobacter aminovorans TaxID=83263 RepID=A0A380WR44_AMIAI|nr:VirB8 protein [Aminobacter aminovorans]SUU91301.1 conjugal transfer protein TrbF [Aminobacter aminovorans]